MILSQNNQVKVTSEIVLYLQEASQWLYLLLSLNEPRRHEAAAERAVRCNGSATGRVPWALLTTPVTPALGLLTFAPLLPRLCWDGWFPQQLLPLVETQSTPTVLPTRVPGQLTRPRSEPPRGAPVPLLRALNGLPAHLQRLPSPRSPRPAAWPRVRPGLPEAAPTAHQVWRPHPHLPKGCKMRISGPGELKAGNHSCPRHP